MSLPERVGDIARRLTTHCQICGCPTPLEYGPVCETCVADCHDICERS